MTVSAQPTIFQYVGNGVTTVFAYNCQVLQPSDLNVYVNGSTITSGIVKGGIGSLTGGTVTFSVAPANGAQVILEREVVLERTTDYQQNGDFLSRVVNPDFNRIWMALQQLLTGVTRSLKFPKSDVAPVTELPPAASRANLLLGFDGSGNPVAIAPAAQSATALSILLATFSGSSLIGFIQAGVAAVMQTIQDKLRQETSFFDYMTSAQKTACLNRTGLVDVYAACQAAIDGAVGTVRMPPGLFVLTQKLIIRNACTGIVGNGAYSSTFEKRFNGDLISSVIDGAVFSSFGVNGVGATYTGGGIVPEGYNTKMQDLRIDDTADSPIMFKAAIGTNVGSGTYSSVRDCFLRPTNATTTYAIRSIGNDDATRPTCRTFEKLSGGSSLVDFSGMNFCSLVDSLGTMVKFSANSGKINMKGNRITSSTSFTVFGVDHVIDDNMMGFSVGNTITIDSTCSNVKYGPSNAMSINGAFGKSPTLNAAVGAANPNFIHSELTAYAFGWLGAGGNPAIGNASTFAYYKLSGQQCYATMGLVVGTTTVAGSGEYSFQLPFKAFVTSTGPALVKAAGGQYYEGTFIVQGGASVGTIYLSDATTTTFASTSLSFGTGSTLNVTLDYLVAPA